MCEKATLRRSEHFPGSNACLSLDLFDSPAHGPAHHHHARPASVRPVVHAPTAGVSIRPQVVNVKLHNSFFLSDAKDALTEYRWKHGREQRKDINAHSAHFLRYG